MHQDTDKAQGRIAKDVMLHDTDKSQGRIEGCSMRQDRDKAQGRIAKDVPCVKSQIYPKAG